jgi:hypothetical protein
MMDLFEGNNFGSVLGDIIHGPHYFGTLFRNLLNGSTENSPQVTGYGLGLHTHNRFFNIVGNVFGYSGWTKYETDFDDDGQAVYVLGWQGNASGGTVQNDPDVIRTLMRWGNWDSVNNATRWQSSEVPSGLANYANPVPPSQTLPASFYLSSRPSWWSTPWGTPPWPAIGPDVSGGDISNSPTGTHASKIPARLCFENTALDSAYPSSNPRVRLFDASTCYGGGDTTIPSVPRNLRTR